MDSAQGHYGKPARRSLSIDVGPETACCAKRRTRSEELFHSALSPTTAELEFGLRGPAQISARTRLAYGLLKAAIDEAVQSIQANNMQFADECRRLEARAIESIYASALATIEFMDAVSADGPTNAAARQIAHSRRPREVLNDEVMNFLAAARNMISALTAPVSGPSVDCSRASTCPTTPCETQNVVERLKTLTERQRRVLELIADGLPNKIIAYRLGVCETTVKAHVSEILRKLCVYSRARAIVLLANTDLASIGLSNADAKSGGR
jgi:DNA-binding NarL/FixJ family response regulator